MQTTSKGARPVLVVNFDVLDRLAEAHGIKSRSDLLARLGMDAKSASTLWRVKNGHSIGSPEFLARVRLAFPSASMDDLFTVREVA